MKTNKIFEVTIPGFIFPGFYNTEFDADNILTNEEGESYTGEEENYYELVEEYQNRVIENIINHYKEVLPEDFKIVEYKLDSPKEYNYRNDSIDLLIETSYENILHEFFAFESENLIDCLDYETNEVTHEALLEVLLEFWPFTGKYEDLYETTLYEKFIYG